MKRTTKDYGAVLFAMFALPSGRGDWYGSNDGSTPLCGPWQQKREASPKERRLLHLWRYNGRLTVSEDGFAWKKTSGLIPDASV